MDEEVTIDSREVAKMIGREHKHLRESIKKFINRFNENITVSDYYIDSTYINLQNKKQPCYIITLKGVKHIIDNLQKYSKLEPLINWYNKFDGKTETIILQDRPELQFINKLEQTLYPFNLVGERQYRVLDYRIDYYILSLNIAIEYDENGHKNYTYEKQELRQALIEKELGCKFIRVSDKYSDEYNIGLVFKKLFQIAC